MLRQGAETKKTLEILTFHFGEKMKFLQVPKFHPKMYTKNALAQKANEPGLPPYLSKKTFYRKRLSHTLFSNQKLRNSSKLDFFLLKGHKICSKSCKVWYPQNAPGVKTFLAITTRAVTSFFNSGWAKNEIR